MLTSLYNESGTAILVQPDFEYTCFDKKMNASRTVTIRNYAVENEYWVAKSDTIYIRAKHGAELNSQISLLLKYVQKKMKYPNEAFNKGVEGTVRLSFIVNREGEIVNITPLTSIGYGLEQAGVQLLEKYKMFGKIFYNKKPINLYFEFPLRFAI